MTTPILHLLSVLSNILFHMLIRLPQEAKIAWGLLSLRAPIENFKTYLAHRRQTTTRSCCSKTSRLSPSLPHWTRAIITWAPSKSLNPDKSLPLIDCKNHLLVKWCYKALLAYRKTYLKSKRALLFPTKSKINSSRWLLWREMRTTIASATKIALLLLGRIRPTRSRRKHRTTIQESSNLMKVWLVSQLKTILQPFLSTAHIEHQCCEVALWIKATIKEIPPLTTTTLKAITRTKTRSWHRRRFLQKELHHSEWLMLLQINLKSFIRRQEEDKKTRFTSRSVHRPSRPNRLDRLLNCINEKIAIDRE